MQSVCPWRRTSTPFTVFSKLPPKTRRMPVEYGQCLNRAGCSLAYTGEIIRYEGEARCPECGQPLGPARRARRRLPWITGVAVLMVLMAAITAFLVWQRRSQPEGLPHRGGPLAGPQAEENRGPAMVEGNTTALPPDLARTLASNATPAPTPSGGSGTPPQIVNERAEASKAASAAVPATPAAASPAPTAAAARDVSPAEESVVTKPPMLSVQQVDTTRADVLKRINAMPKMSAQDKDRLSQKVESAHAMERLRIIHFDRGKTTLSRTAMDELARSFGTGETKNQLADPTLVLVVAGYADSGGDAASHLRISEDRAEGISKLLGKAGVLNVVHTVAMGSTALLDSKRPEQNRAVEIWAVVP